MSDVQPPSNIDVAVVPLPDHQKPYGDSLIARDIQAILWHYEANPVTVKILEDEGFKSLKCIKYADPEGGKDQRDLFAASVADKVKSKLQCAFVKAAFRRILSKNPMAAIVAGPPVKRLKVLKPVDSSAALPAAPPVAPPVAPPAAPPAASAKAAPASSSASGPSTSSASSAASSGASSTAPAPATADDPGENDDDSSDDDDEYEDVDAGGVASGDVDKSSIERDGAKPVRRKDLITLFNDFGSEVTA